MHGAQNMSECIPQSPKKNHMHPCMCAYATVQTLLCHGCYCELFGTRPKKTSARVGWLKRLRLVHATWWATFEVIRDQLSSTMTEIFLCVAFSYKNCSLFQIIANYCRPQKRPMIWIWVLLLWEFRHFESQHRFLYQRIVWSLFASMPSPYTWIPTTLYNTTALASLRYIW